MASLAVMIGGEAINSLAFSRSNYLFSKLSVHGEAEHKRHDLAMEKFQRAKDLWNKERLKKLTSSIRDYVSSRMQSKLLTT